MLKLIRDKTTEITEADLIPGSKWKRKSDGAECVLCKCGKDYPWFLMRDFVVVEYDEKNETYSNQASEMLTWLRRDFERAGDGAPRIMKLSEVPVGHSCIVSSHGILTKLACDSKYGWPGYFAWSSNTVESWGDGTHTECKYLGPIIIDASVLGGDA